MAERSPANPSLLDHPLIAGRYFFPREGDLSDPFPIDCGDVRLACHYRQVDAEGFTLVHFHGNGEIVDDYVGDFVDEIARMGCNCLLVEYRGYGGSQGRPQLAKMLDDVSPVVRALGVPAQRLIFFGRSVGSIFALEGAARFPEAAGLVLESAVADVRERLLMRVHPSELGVSTEEFDRAVADRLDHRRKLESYPGPFLVMHTRNDGLVDVSHAERLHRWAPGRKSLHIFERGNHNTILYANSREYFGRIESFIRGLPGE